MLGIWKLGSVILVLSNSCEFIDGKRKKSTRRLRNLNIFKTDFFDEEGAPQPGYTFGMVRELDGSWVGNEKFKYEGITNNYCSVARFDPRVPLGGGMGTWDGRYVGDDGDGSSCATIGVDPVAGGVNNSRWFSNLDLGEVYHYVFEQMQCLSGPACEYDVTESGILPGYKVAAKGCGAHLKTDITNDDMYWCELYQSNLMYNEITNSTELVVVLTYQSYSGGYNNYTCPQRVTYNVSDLEADDDAEGAALFVHQNSYTTDVYDSSNWDCELE